MEEEEEGEKEEEEEEKEKEEERERERHYCTRAAFQGYQTCIHSPFSSMQSYSFG